MDNVLINAMSDEDLLANKAKYPNNESVQTLIDGILEARKKEKEQAKLAIDFGAKVAKLAKLPAPPEAIHNVYLAWKQVDIAQGEPQEVEVPATTTTPAHKEMRQPTVKQWTWVVETNKGFTQGKGTTSTGTTPSKRAVTVNKRDGQTLKFVGNFQSASKACEYLKLNIGGDSATRVLARDGYILDAYTGNDFTT